MRAKMFGLAMVMLSGACGGDELFDVQLDDNEHRLDDAAQVTIGSESFTFDQVTVVGDLDGDGIDDAIVRPMSLLTQVEPDAVYVVYGGSDGNVDLDSAPSLVGVGENALDVTVTPVGDVNGDGLADFLVARVLDVTCNEQTGDDQLGGVFLIYGSRTRLAGATAAVSAGAFLRSSVMCGGSLGQPWLGDLDGDGKADFAIATFDTVANVEDMHVYYGNSTRLSGTIDLVAAADAVLAMPAHPAGSVAQLYGVGDVDGDGHADVFVSTPLDVNTGATDLRLVHGSATRWTGTVVLADLPQSTFVNAVLAPFTSTAVTPLGDLDGDGLADFAVAQRAPFGQQLFYGRSFPAQVDITAADASLTATGNVLNPVTQIASGDVDGDGIRDLVITDVGFDDNDGGAAVLRGTSSRLAGIIDPSAAPTVYVGTRQRLVSCQPSSDNDCIAHERIGTFLGVGDFRGEGHASILLSAPWYNFLDQVSIGKYGAMSRTYIVSPNP